GQLQKRPPDHSTQTRPGEDGGRPCGGGVELMGALLSHQAPRRPEAGDDFGGRRARGDGVAEQVACQVLAVVLAIAPIQGTVLLLGRLTTTELDSPDHPDMACTIRGLDPSL